MKKKQKALTKADLSEALYKKLGYSRKFNEELLERLLFLVKSRLQNGQGVKIHRFGTFDLKEKKSRKGRNPATGRTLRITARRIVSFRPSSVLRELFKAPGGKKPAKSGKS